MPSEGPGMGETELPVAGDIFVQVDAAKKLIQLSKTTRRFSFISSNVAAVFFRCPPDTDTKGRAGRSNLSSVSGSRPRNRFEIIRQAFPCRDKERAYLG